MQFSYYIMTKPHNVVDLISQLERNRQKNIELTEWVPPYEIDEAETIISTPLYYVTQAYETSPPWLWHFDLPDDIQLKNAGTAAAIFAEFDSHWVVICFGHSNHLLNQDYLVDDFGMRAALVSVDTGKIGQITTLKPDHNSIEKRQKLTFASDRSQLEIDVDRELATTMHGYAEIDEIPLWMDGQRGLKLRGGIKETQILTIGAELLARYKNGTIPADYQWTTNIREIKDSILVDHLNERLSIEICQVALAQKEHNIQFSNFSNISFSEVDTYRFMNISKKGIYPEYSAEENSNLSTIDFSCYLKTLSIHGDNFSADDILNKHKVVIKFHDSSQTERGLKRLIHFVTELDGKYYLLLGGRWFQFSSDFINTVEETLEALEVINITPIMPRHNETELNTCLKSFCSSEEPKAKNFLVLDQRKISMKNSGYSHANLEACDLIDCDGHFVHIKSAESSASLSHLAAQAEASATLWRQSDEFRKGVFDHIKNSKPELVRRLFVDDSHDLKMRPTVVFSILSSRIQAMSDIFLLAKLTLYTAIKKIKQQGFDVKFEFLIKPMNLID